MSSHPDKNKIIRAASGLDDISEVSEHINSCPECGKYFHDITRVLSSSDNSKLSVSEDVEHRIINSYRNIKLDTAKISGKKLSGFLKPAIATFVVIASTVLSLLFYSSYYKDEERKISFKAIYGDSFVNGVHFDEILISSGDRIETKTASSSELEIEKMFFVNIYPDSELLVEKSVYSKKEKSNVFDFRIFSGTIFAKFEKSAELKYSVTTADARIESLGTEFLIEITKDGTTVIVTEGALSVTSLKSGETKIAEVDKIFTVRENIEVSDVDKTIFMDKESLRDEHLMNWQLKDKAEKVSSKPEIKPEIDMADKNEARKMLNETKKEINKEMRGELRKDMKKERGGGFGK